MITNHTGIAPTETWGVIGGMGPIASAEFLKTIYEQVKAKQEQEAPVVILVSDPTFPDRTECFLSNQKEALLRQLHATLLRLDSFQVTKIIICCVTIHYLLPLLPEELKRKIVSLLDLALSSVVETGRKHLLLCSTGSRQMRLFENHDLWEKAEHLIAMPSEEDQDAIHTLIYRLKVNSQSPDDLDFLYSLMARYEVDSFIAACTEIHLLSRQLRHSGRSEIHCVDPLMILADRIVENGSSS